MLKLVFAAGVVFAFSLQFTDAQARGEQCRRGFDFCYNKCLSKGGKGKKSPAAACSKSCGKKCGDSSG